MHDYGLYGLSWSTLRSIALIREQYAGHVPERCLHCGRRDHPGACELPLSGALDASANPDYVSPAVAKASRALAASEKLLSENNDPRLVDGFGIVFGPGYEHSK